MYCESKYIDIHRDLYVGPFLSYYFLKEQNARKMNVIPVAVLLPLFFFSHFFRTRTLLFVSSYPIFCLLLFTAIFYFILYLSLSFFTSFVSICCTSSRSFASIVERFKITEGTTDRCENGKKSVRGRA